MTFDELISQFARFVRRINNVDVTQMCGLAASATSTKIKTTIDIIYFLYNAQYALDATDPITVTACAQQAVGKFCYYLVSVNASGTVTTTKGTNDTYALPATPADNVAIGAFKIVTDATHTFTAGTTAFDATGITASFFSIDCGVAAMLLNQEMTEVETGVQVQINDRILTFSNFEHMRVNTTVAIEEDDYEFDNPFTNYKELISCMLINSDGRTYPPLKVVDRPSAMRLYPNLTDDVGRPRMISSIPVTEATLTPDISPTFKFLLRPTSDDDYTADLDAYQYSPLLDGVIYTQNWWTLYQPDILLYGALMRASAFFKDDSRVPLWDSIHKRKLTALVMAEKSKQFAGSDYVVENPYIQVDADVDDYGD